MGVPANYPLPVHEASGQPFCWINLILCHGFPGWREFQAFRPISQIIPVILWLLESSLASLFEDVA